MYYIDLRLFLPHNTGSSFWKIVFYKMWKLLMEFLHSILSSLFFFTFIKFVSFWEENSQFLSWLNKKEILRNQKSALLSHYTPPPGHSTQHKHHSIHRRSNLCTGHWGHESFLSWIFWEIGKSHSYGRAEAVSDEGWWESRSWVSVGSKELWKHPRAMTSFHFAVKAPSSTPPGGSLPRSSDWSLHRPLHHCGNILGVFHLSDLCLYFSVWL